VGWSAGAGVAKAFGYWNVGVEYLCGDLGRPSSIRSASPSTTGSAPRRSSRTMERR